MESNRVRYAMHYPPTSCKNLDMTKPGRKKTPSALRVLRGNPSHRPLHGAEPEPDLIDEKLEPTLPLTTFGRSCWERIIDNLKAIKLLTVVDLDALSRYCQTLDEYQLAVLDVRKQGRTLTKRTMHDEVTVANPRFSQMQQLSRDLSKLEAEFGFTPSSRSSLSVPSEASGGSDWEEFLFGSAT